MRCPVYSSTRWPVRMKVAAKAPQAWMDEERSSTQSVMTAK
jgi:hypothetical protein